jgi:Holliday junction DNA helicase RuvB
MYRPEALTEFIGQEQIARQVRTTLAAASKMSKPLPHMLFYGPRGTGKTTIANLVVKESNAVLVEVSPSSLKNEDDIWRMFSNHLRADTHTVFLLDEIHRLPPKSAELLYQPMESYIFTRGTRGKYGVKNTSYKMAPFSIVGATTNLGKLPEPFRDRFGLVLSMEYYSEEEIFGILAQAATKQQYGVDREAVKAIVERCRNNPRLANTYLDRCHDLQVVANVDVINIGVVTGTFDLLRVDDNGLTHEDLRYLKLLGNAGRPVGLTSMETAMGLDAKTLAETVEPFLIQKGLVIVSPSGRMLTDSGEMYLASKDNTAGMTPQLEAGA